MAKRTTRIDWPDEAPADAVDPVAALQPGQRADVDEPCVFGGGYAAGD